MADPISAMLTAASVVQLGFSVVTTLWSFIDQVKGAKDEISFQVQEVSLSADMARQLDKLMTTMHEKQNGLISDDTYANAKKQLEMCGQVFAEIWKLLLQGPHGPSTFGVPQEVVSDLNIKVNLEWYNRAMWPALRGRLTDPTTKLRALKDNMTGLYSQFTASIIASSFIKDAASADDVKTQKRAAYEKEMLLFFARRKKLAMHLKQSAQAGAEQTNGVATNSVAVTNGVASRGPPRRQASLLAELGDFDLNNPSDSEFQRANASFDAWRTAAAEKMKQEADAMQRWMKQQQALEQAREAELEQIRQDREREVEMKKTADSKLLQEAILRKKEEEKGRQMESLKAEVKREMQEEEQKQKLRMAEQDQQILEQTKAVLKDVVKDADKKDEMVKAVEAKLTASRLLARGLTVDVIEVDRSPNFDDQADAGPKRKPFWGWLTGYGQKGNRSKPRNSYSTGSEATYSSATSSRVVRKIEVWSLGEPCARLPLSCAPIDLDDKGSKKSMADLEQKFATLPSLYKSQLSKVLEEKNYNSNGTFWVILALKFFKVPRAFGISGRHLEWTEVHATIGVDPGSVDSEDDDDSSSGYSSSPSLGNSRPPHQAPQPQIATNHETIRPVSQPIYGARPGSGYVRPDSKQENVADRSYARSDISVHIYPGRKDDEEAAEEKEHARGQGNDEPGEEKRTVDDGRKQKLVEVEDYVRTAEVAFKPPPHASQARHENIGPEKTSAAPGGIHWVRSSMLSEGVLRANHINWQFESDPEYIVIFDDLSIYDQKRLLIEERGARTAQGKSLDDLPIPKDISGDVPLSPLSRSRSRSMRVERTSSRSQMARSSFSPLYEEPVYVSRSRSRPHVPLYPETEGGYVGPERHRDSYFIPAPPPTSQRYRPSMFSPAYYPDDNRHSVTRDGSRTISRGGLNNSSDRRIPERKVYVQRVEEVTSEIGSDDDMNARVRRATEINLKSELEKRKAALHESNLKAMEEEQQWKKNEEAVRMRVEEEKRKREAENAETRQEKERNNLVGGLAQAAAALDIASPGERNDITYRKVAPPSAINIGSGMPRPYRPTTGSPLRQGYDRLTSPNRRGSTLDDTQEPNRSILGYLSRPPRTGSNDRTNYRSATVEAVADESVARRGYRHVQVEDRDVVIEPVASSPIDNIYDNDEPSPAKQVSRETDPTLVDSRAGNSSLSRPQELHSSDSDAALASLMTATYLDPMLDSNIPAQSQPQDHNSQTIPIAVSTTNPTIPGPPPIAFSVKAPASRSESSYAPKAGILRETRAKLGSGSAPNQRQPEPQVPRGGVNFDVLKEIFGDSDNGVNAVTGGVGSIYEGGDADAGAEASAMKAGLDVMSQFFEEPEQMPSNYPAVREEQHEYPSSPGTQGTSHIDNLEDNEKRQDEQQLAETKDEKEG